MISKSKQFLAPLAIGPLAIGPFAIGSLLAAAACLVVTGTAQAQPGATPPGSVPPYAPTPAPTPAAPAPAPYYGPNYGPNYGPAQPPVQSPVPAAKKKTRQGWNIGVSFGVGSLVSSIGEFDCVGCETEPPALAFDLHVGSMIVPRLALQVEFWGQIRPLDRNGDSSIGQRMFLLAAQYWITPRFWVKGGLGLAALTLNYYNGFEDVNEPLDSGSAFMAAIGYEIVRSSGFAFDIQLKTGSGMYDARNEEVSAGVVALGVNWY